MKEVGIDLSSARPQLLTEETARVPPLMMESQAGWAMSGPSLNELDAQPRIHQ
jgi:hypothetical protein